MTTGLFDERTLLPAFAATRHDRLHTEQWYPNVWTQPRVECAATRLSSRLSEITHLLSDFGCAEIHLCERIITSQELLEFAVNFGNPIPETSPPVKEFVELGSVLNLQRRFGTEVPVDIQPFAADAILLHSEGSRNPIERQPRLLVFQCVETTDSNCGGQTVLVDMREIVRRLDERARGLLKSTRYANMSGCPPFLRESESRSVFSFRDFGLQPMPWVNESKSAVDEVNGAISQLVVGLYSAPWTGVHWEKGTLILLDNTRFFHGRTAILSEAPRHLQRVRLL